MKLSKHNEMLLKIKKPVSNENKEICERDIELKDIEKAIKPFQIKSVNDGRTVGFYKSGSDGHTVEFYKSGNDGHTVEFYKTFSDRLKENLRRLYGKISEKRRMPDSMW